MKKRVVKLTDGRQLTYFTFEKNITDNEVSKMNESKEVKKCQN